MHIIIIGCGKVGSSLAYELASKGHDIVIVDSDRSAFKALHPDFNGVMVAGVPIDQDVLKQAGIETADALAAVTPDDNVNIMACQVAKEIFQVPRVLARIFNPAREHVFHQFGLDTICPTNLTVGVISSIIQGKTTISRHTIGSNTLSFIHEKVEEGDVGKKIGELQIEPDRFIFGIIRKGDFNFAHFDIRLEEGDFLVVSEKVD